MPLHFTVEGPFVVPRTGLPGGWVIENEDIDLFWEDNAHLAEEHGCYVFGVRAGRGVLPGYVGRATRSFRQEVFNSHKLVKYHRYMARTRKGTPVLFFAVAERSSGKVNLRAIADCEFELINLAWRTNPDIVNERGLTGPSFIIPHVTENGRGRPSDASRDFCAMLGLPEVGPPRIKIRVENKTPFLVSLNSILGPGHSEPRTPRSTR